MGGSQSKDVGELRDPQDGAIKKSFDYVRNKFKPKQESNGKRIRRLTEEVKATVDLVINNREAFKKLGYTMPEFSSTCEKIAGLQAVAWKAYTKKDFNRKKQIDKFEEQCKPLFTIRERLREALLEPAQQISEAVKGYNEETIEILKMQEKLKLDSADISFEDIKMCSNNFFRSSKYTA